MKKKSEAQIYLEGYELDKVKMECKLEERQYWHDQSLRMTGQMFGDRVQSSGTKDTMAKARDVCKEKENEILAQVQILSEKQTEVSGVLDQMTNPTEYKVLHQRYIQSKDFAVIADNFNSDYTWATTTHGRAIKSVEAILERTMSNA